MNNGVEIVDAQVHLWSGGKPSAQHRQVESFSAEHLLKEMDEAGVDAALIHPPLSWAPGAGALAIEAVKKYPERFAIMGQFALDKPENHKLMTNWKQQPGMLGLRWPLISVQQQNWITDGSLDWLWPEAGRLGIPVATMAGRFLPEFRKIAERNPQTKLIIDHLGLAREGKDDEAFATLPDLLAIAKLPNVAMKATGAPGYSSHAWPYRNIHDGLHRLFDAFGPQRWFWGTDITRMPCSYHQCVTMFTEELPWLKGKDLELVMGRGLREWLGWKRPAK